MIIAERFKLTDRIGRGGMGVVYRGTDMHTGATIAAKQLHADLLQDPEMLERFKREAQALRRVNHPHIVQIIDAVEQDSQHYLVMEFLAGGDLYALLRRSQLPIYRVLGIGSVLADALACAHKVGVIHRDLKPENVLLDDQGQPHLTDFGTAKINDFAQLTQPGFAVGTLDYIAPEAILGGVVDSRADIWSLGVLLFEMVTHKRPFEGDTSVEIMLAVANDPLPDITQLRPDVPPELAALLDTMLQREPEQRLQPMDAVTIALDKLANQYAVQASANHP